MTRIIKTTLGYASDKRHLAAFEPDTNGTAGTGGLAFATASAGLAVAAGFALAKAFATVFRPGARLEIM